jgi:hypothetical protein
MKTLNALSALFENQLEALPQGAARVARPRCGRLDSFATIMLIMIARPRIGVWGIFENEFYRIVLGAATEATGNFM